MKRLLALLLAILMVTCCLFAVGCQKPEEPEDPAPTPGNGEPEGDEPEAPKPRTFIAGYERLIPKDGATVTMNYRVLLCMNSDGTMDAYVSFLGDGEAKTAQYTGTYSFGVNDENDETLTFSYKHGDTTETVTEAVIVDGLFTTTFYLIDAMSPTDVKFYETANTAMDGETYIGYLAKYGTGMGNLVYSYVLNLKDDGTFNVSILYMAAAMHVIGESTGTYTVEGDKITFTYALGDGEGGVVIQDGAPLNDYTSEGTKNADGTISTSFNIALPSPRASAALFLKLK